MNHDTENNNGDFSQLDFGTKISTTGLEVIDITYNKEIMFEDFANAHFKELGRLNPIKFDHLKLTAEDLDYYISGLIAIRIDSIHDNCKVWRQAKQLNVPSWIQYNISQIGIVVDRDRGLRFVPNFDFEYEIDKMLLISDELSQFKSDGLTLHKNAFPLSNEGDKDVMGMVIIDDFVHSLTPDAHPIASYVGSFLGATLREEATFKMLFRTRYDDVEFIRSMLMRNEVIR